MRRRSLGTWALRRSRPRSPRSSSCTTEATTNSSRRFVPMRFRRCSSGIRNRPCEIVDGSRSSAKSPRLAGTCWWRKPGGNRSWRRAGNTSVLPGFDSSLAKCFNPMGPVYRRTMISEPEILDVREPPGKAMGKVAELWKPVEGTNKIMCTACARYCKIGEGQAGLCGIRGVHEGKLWLYVYGRVITGHVDPIEKKPVSHYRPGSKIFSIATTGCNWLCRYCFPPGTEVITDRGRETIEAIFQSSAPTDKDEVRQVRDRSALTHRGRWRRIMNAFEHFYSGPVLVLDPAGMDSLECTPNHRVFASVKGGAMKEIRADQLEVGDCLVIPRATGLGRIRGMPRWVETFDRIEKTLATVTASGSTLLLQRAKLLDQMVTDDYVFMPIRKIRAKTYVGPVYNIEVEEDHSYTANFMAVANCQNADISQRRKVEGIEVEPQDVVRMTLEQGCQGLAYTYNQPTIFIEFARDIGMMARKAGLLNIFVSNGYDTPETVAEMPKFLDCVTVDFKGSGETNFVRKYINIPNADPIFQTLLDTRDTKN